MDWQSLGTCAGAAILGLAGLQTLRAAQAGRRSRLRLQDRCAQRQETFQQQLQAVLQWAHAARPTLKAWSGTREFQVAAVVDEALACRSYYLVPQDGRPLPRFEPGQYLTFELPTGGRSKPLVRCYSLSARSREDYYRVTIKRQDPPSDRPELPPGEGSDYFHTQVRSGTTLAVQAPQGSFFLDPTDACPVVLVGAGIGITPLLSMAETISHNADRRTTYLLTGFRNGSEHPFASSLRDVAVGCDHLHLVTSYSKPQPNDRIGIDYQHRGHVDMARIRQVLPSNNFRFYLCGPPAMMESLVPALLEWGVPETDIRFEAFGPASVKCLGASVASVGPCTVKFSQAECEVAWDDSLQSLLELAENANVPLDYGCRAGNCGQCLLTVREGAVQHVKPPGVAVDEGQCLACIAVPQGDVVLDA